MKNVTLSIDDTLLKESRFYARKHHTTLNNLVRETLNKTVHSQNHEWINQAFSIADKAQGTSQGAQWKREDLYER